MEFSIQNHISKDHSRWGKWLFKPRTSDFKSPLELEKSKINTPNFPWLFNFQKKNLSEHKSNKKIKDYFSQNDISERIKKYEKFDFVGVPVLATFSYFKLVGFGYLGIDNWALFKNYRILGIKGYLLKNSMKIFEEIFNLGANSQSSLEALKWKLELNHVDWSHWEWIHGELRMLSL